MAYKKSKTVRLVACSKKFDEPRGLFCSPFQCGLAISPSTWAVYNHQLVLVDISFSRNTKLQLLSLYELTLLTGRHVTSAYPKGDNRLLNMLGLETTWNLNYSHGNRNFSLFLKNPCQFADSEEKKSVESHNRPFERDGYY